MELKLHTQGMKANAPLEEKVNRVVEKLTRMAVRLQDSATEVKVNLKHEESRSLEDAFSCQITIFAPGDTLHAESRSASIETALDETEDKLVKQIEHYKAKWA